MTTTTTRTAVDTFLAAVVSGRFAEDAADVYAVDAVVDATVPNWRFPISGASAILAQFDHWFADPAAYDELERIPLPDGELVRFAISWTEHGVRHAAHQAHVLTVADGRITSDAMFCGGRWPEPLIAEMAAARDAHHG